jgi:hypothetical protein
MCTQGFNFGQEQPPTVPNKPRSMCLSPGDTDLQVFLRGASNVGAPKGS